MNVQSDYKKSKLIKSAFAVEHYRRVNLKVRMIKSMNSALIILDCNIDYTHLACVRYPSLSF